MCSRDGQRFAIFEYQQLSEMFLSLLKLLEAAIEVARHNRPLPGQTPLIYSAQSHR
jgi:hypothetical protein